MCPDVVDPIQLASDQTTERISETRRKDLLAERVMFWTGRDWKVESQSDFQATIVLDNRPNHVLHLILSIITLGAWLIVWLFITLFTGEKRKTITIAPNGRAIES